MFEGTIGNEYQTTVRITISQLSHSKFDLTTLKTTSGRVQLAFYEGKLQSYATKIEQMNGKVGILGDQLMILVRQYDKLGKSASVSRGLFNAYNKQIDSNKVFIIKELKELENNLGENNVKWYKELSKPNSKISNMIWKQYKEYEKSQK